MIAADREVVAPRIRVNAAFHFAYPSPKDIRWIPILLIARHNTTFASNALCHVEMKAILLSGFRHWKRRTTTMGATKGCVPFDRFRLRDRDEAAGLFCVFEQGKFHNAPEQ